MVQNLQYCQDLSPCFTESGKYFQSCNLEGTKLQDVVHLSACIHVLLVSVQSFQKSECMLLLYLNFTVI